MDLPRVLSSSEEGRDCGLTLLVRAVCFPDSKSHGCRLHSSHSHLITLFLDQQVSAVSNPSPCASVTAEGKTVRQPSVLYSWIQNKREQVGGHCGFILYEPVGDEGSHSCSFLFVLCSQRQIDSGNHPQLNVLDYIAFHMT